MTTSAAVKSAEDQRKDAEKATEKAAKVAAERAAIEKKFQDAGAKAAEDRAKALAKLSPGTNIAETAWNETKVDDDPVYTEATADHRRKLDTALEAIKTSGTAGIVGLELFEARCIELLDDLGTPAGTIAPFVPGEPERVTTAEEVADSDKKTGRPKASK